MSYQQVEVNYVSRHFAHNDTLLKFLLKHGAIAQDLADSCGEDLEDVGEN